MGESPWGFESLRPHHNARCNSFPLPVAGGGAVLLFEVPGNGWLPGASCDRLGIVPIRLGVIWGFSAVHTQQGEHRFKHTRQT